MANKTFVSNSTLTISDSNTEALGSSITGQEIVKIRSGITGVQLDANFERIDLSGTLASYKFVVVSGTGLQIQNVSNSAVVATIPNINQNVKIAFTDGSATLAQAGGTVFTLNSATLAVGATSAAATVSLAGGNVLNQAAGETSTVATTLVTTLATNATAFTGSIADSDMLDVGIFALTSAAVLSGGIGGLGAANTIAVKDGANISSGAITYFTDLLFDATGVSGTNDLTMTVAQHAGFTGVITAAGTGTNGEKITLTTIATGLSLFPSVENYVLGNFTNSVTQTAVGQAITGNADVDTVTAITGVTSTSDLAAGANVVIVPTGANISAGTFSATVGTVTLNLNGATTATLKAAQASEAAISAATGTNNVTISDVMTGVTLDVDVETYTLANQANTVTLGTAAGSLAQNVVGGSSTDVLTLGAGAYTGTWTSISGLSLVTGNTSIATVNNGTSAGAALAGSPTLLITGGGSVTMTAEQHVGLGAITAAGTDSITLTTAASGLALNAAIETYVLADAANTVTLGTAAGNLAQTVTGGNNTDVLTLGAGTYTGKWTAISGLSLVTGNTSIAAVNNGTSAGAALAGSPTLLITGGGNATMTAAQYQGLGTITAAGTDTVTFSTAITGSATGVTDIESYVLAGSTTNAFTLDKAAETVTASAGADNINVIALPSANTILVGLAAADTITTATGANLSLAKYHATTAATAAAGSAALVTGAGILVFAGTVTVSAAQLDGFITLTGTSTPILTSTTAITATMLDDAVVTNSLTTIKLADVASNVITAANATVPSTNVLIIDGSSLANNAFTFTGTAENSGTFNITGGAQVDTLTGSATTAAGDVFNYYTTAGLVANNAVVDLVDGGAGALDELRLTNADTNNALTIATGDALTRISNVEKITAGSSAGVISITRPANATQSSANFTTIDLSGDINTAGINVISNTGSNAITTIIGSAGIDQIAVATSAPATTVTGGAGVDTYTITAPAAAITIADLGNGNDVLTTVTSGTTNATMYLASGAVSYTPASGAIGASTTAVLTVGAATSGTVNLSGMTANAGTLTLTATAATGPLTLVGTGGSEAITGGAGADTITGGLLIDTLTGGSGADSFVLTGVVLAANRDSIADFVSGTDKLVLGIAQTTVTTAAAATAITGTSTTAAAAGNATYTLAGNNTAGTPATITTGNVDIIKIANIATASANNGDLSTAGVLDGTELLKAMTDTTATDTYTGIVSTNGDTGYIQATQGGVTYLYYYAESGNTTLAAAEIILVGTFSNAAVLVAGDITLA